jgi:hypothetical protein
VKPLALGIKHFLDANAFNLVTRVPPKPSAERDSVGALLRAAAKSSRYGLSDLVLLDAIRCVRDYPPQKSRGSFERRVKNVDGVFAADRAVSGHHVLLVDDVLTSGATLISCAKALLDAGAASVGALVIGYNQNRIHRDAGFPCEVSGCVGMMNLRLSTKSGTAFWGCSRWREDGTGCKARWFYRKGLRMCNMRNRMESIEVVPEIEF